MGSWDYARDSTILGNFLSDYSVFMFNEVF